MSLPRFALLFVLIAFAKSAAAQQAVTTPQPMVLLQQSLAALAPPTPIRDDTLSGTVPRIAGSDSESGTAIDLLKKARIIAGWTIDWSAVSFQYSATTNLTSQAQGAGRTLQIEGKSSGPRKLAVRTSTPDSVVSTIINGTEAQIVSSSGTFLESADSLSEADALFPFLLHAMTQFDDGSFSAVYTGQVALPQGEAYLIVLTPTPKPGDYPEDGKSMRAPETRIWLSVQTLLPIQMETPRAGMHNSISFVTVKRQFSDYRMMGNIAVPFLIQESLNDGDAVQSVTVNSIQFGALIPDSEFSIQP